MRTKKKEAMMMYNIYMNNKDELKVTLIFLIIWLVCVVALFIAEPVVWSF